MAEKKKISKVMYGNEPLIDLTNDTVDEAYLLVGKTAHRKDGEIIEGKCEYDAKTTIEDGSGKEAVSATEILAGKTAFVNKQELTGSMPNIGKETLTVTDVNKPVKISAGYHDGSGEAKVDTTNITPNNIREGVTILNVTGTMSGSEGVVAEAIEVTSTTSEQVKTPSAGYTHISQVTVKKIPYVESENGSNGITVKIG